MPKVLKDLVIDEVSLVDVPANKAARVILMKRGDMELGEKTSLLEKLKKALGLTEGGTDDPNTEDDVEIQKKLEALQAQVAKLEIDKTRSEYSAKIAKAKRVEDLTALRGEGAFKALSEDARTALDTEIETRKGELEAAVKVGKYDTFRSKLPKSLHKAFDEMMDEDKDEFMSRFGKGGVEADPVGKALARAEQRATDLEAQVASLVAKGEVEAILKGDLKDVPGATAELAESVRKLRRADPAAAETLVKQLKGQALQLKASGLFKTLGKDGGEIKKAEDKLDQLAKKRATEKGIAFATAYDQVLQENPDLYTDSLNDKEAE